MPKTTAQIMFISLLLVCFCVPSTVVGYGGGGSEGTDAFASMEPQASGGVSWAPNPNGADVMGSSIWDGRPENIQQGPYQPDKAVEDAEAELLQGLDGGKYTPQQVKEQLEWAQRVGIKLSPQAIKKLNQIKNPPAKPSKTSSSSSLEARNQKQNEKANDFINIFNAVSKAHRNGGSASDIEAAAISAGLKNKWNRIKNKKENQGKSDVEIVSDQINKGLKKFFGY